MTDHSQLNHFTEVEKSFGKARNIISTYENDIIAYFLLILISFAVFQNSLSFVPADTDDLIMLSSVSETSDPITYFWSDWGLGNNAYRPLHSVSIWITYKVFGVSPVANQLLNLILHTAIICLVYKTIRMWQKDAIISFVSAALSLFSINTISPATWISDRPTLFVGLFLLILLNHLFNPNRTQESNILFMVLLSVLALLSKESGLILPIFLLLFSYFSDKTSIFRAKMAIIASITILLYFSLRMLLFGTEAISYSESGYLLGWIKYESLESLSDPLRLFAYVENVAKNFSAPFLPIYNDSGGIAIEHIINQSPTWLLSLSLFSLIFSRRLESPQKFAIMLLLINSFLHYALFRYRVQYIAQLAASIFIGTASFTDMKINKKIIFKLFAAIFLVYNAIWVAGTVHQTLLDKDLMLSYDLEPILTENPGKISDQIYYEVLVLYDQ